MTELYRLQALRRACVLIDNGTDFDPLSVFFIQMVESELLAKSLLDEGAEGLTQRILTKAGVDTSRFSADLDSFL